MENDIASQINEIKSVILGKVGDTETRLAAMQKQLDAIDFGNRERSVGTMNNTHLKDVLADNASVRNMIENKRPNCEIILKGEDARQLIETKATLLESGVGFGTTGVMASDRSRGITAEARQRLTVRGVLASSPTTQAMCDFVRVLAPMVIASPQTEGQPKAEQSVTFASVSEKVQTLACFIPASRQIMDDFSELASFLDSSLRYYVNLEEELQLLCGLGTGVDLNGLITQSTAFSTASLSPSKGWNKLDIIGRAIQQITVRKEVMPTFVICHPNDWWEMRLTKDSDGHYLLGDPQSAVRPSLFGLDVVPTTNIASGTFLVGSGSSEASEIRDRLELVVEVTDSHSDWYTRNLLCVRAEKRLCLIVRRPASYCSGSFSSSPA